MNVPLSVVPPLLLLLALALALAAAAAAALLLLALLLALLLLFLSAPSLKCQTMRILKHDDNLLWAARTELEARPMTRTDATWRLNYEEKERGVSYVWLSHLRQFDRRRFTFML
jgi:hypothetical protein